MTKKARKKSEPTPTTPSLPAHGRLYQTTRVYDPYSLRTAVWVLLRPTRIRAVKEASKTGPKVFRPHPRRLECLTICRCHKKRQHIFLIHSKTLSAGPAPPLGRGWNPRPPARQTGNYPIEPTGQRKKNFVNIKVGPITEGLRYRTQNIFFWPWIQHPLIFPFNSSLHFRFFFISVSGASFWSIRNQWNLKIIISRRGCFPEWKYLINVCLIHTHP